MNSLFLGNKEQREQPRFPEQCVVVFNVKGKPYGYYLTVYPSTEDNIGEMIEAFKQQLESQGEEVIDYQIGIFQGIYIQNVLPTPRALS